MDTASILSRHVALLQMLYQAESADSAPSIYLPKAKVLERLARRDHRIDERTLRRDIQDIKSEYGIEIKNKRNLGYYLAFNDDEDYDSFQVIFGLLVRKQRLDFLGKPATARKLGKYLLLDHDPAQQSAQYLELIWEAVNAKHGIAFEYCKFGKDQDWEARTLRPGLLLEDRSRWYVVGYDLARRGTRTFGLERMRNVRRTDETFSDDPAEGYREIKPNTIGVTCKEGDQVEVVDLHFNAFQAPYIKSVPFHPTQTILEETGDSLTVRIRVVCNPELERELLAHGERVEVLAPAGLRKKIARRLREAAARYAR